MSCPRASTRLAFERLASNAVTASSNPPPKGSGDGNGNGPTTVGSEEGEAEEADHQAAALSRVLLDLLEDKSYGAARGASPGGLTHVAAVVAAAAANNSQRAALIAGRAVPRLLSCLNARHVHEASNGSAQGAAPGAAAANTTPAAGRASAVAVAVAAKGAAATPPWAVATTALQLQHVGGFEAVVSAIGQLLAGAAATGRRVEEALEGGSDEVIDKGFLLAAMKACPSQTADLLAHLVWCGGPPTGEAAVGPAAAAAVVGNGLVARGNGEQEAVVSGVIGERVLKVLLEIVLDACRASSVPVATATSAAAELGRREGAVDLRSAFQVLSRVLHLNDNGVQGRLELAFGRLEAVVRAGERDGGSAAAGCGGVVYLTGKLITSLFVHLPEARPVLSRMWRHLGPASGPFTEAGDE